MAVAPEALQEKALEYVNSAYKTYSNRAGLEKNWEKWDRIFNCISDVKYYEGTADLFPPDTRRACRTLVNFIDEALFGSNPPFKLKGTGGSGDAKNAEVLTDTIIAQSSQIGLRSKVRRMIWSLVKYGTAIVKVSWKIEGRHVISKRKERSLLRKILSGEILEDIKKVVKKFRIDYDNIDFEPKDLRTIFFDPYTPWEKQTCIIERCEVSYDHLKKLEKQKDSKGEEHGIYTDVDQILEKDAKPKDPSAAPGGSATPKVDKERTQFSHIAEITGLGDNYNISGRNYELLEAWCEFDIDGDGLKEECVIVIIDQKWVLRLDPNPYDDQKKPFLSTVWELIEGTCLGQGVPQLCEKSQIALNDFVNQIMDNITQILNNMWIVDALANIPKLQLKSRPNGVIKSDAGVDAVKAVEKQNTANEGLKAVAMMKDDIKNISSATSALQGLPTKYGTTLGEVNQQASSSARDVFAIMREIEDHIIKPFLQRAYSYDLQFLSREDFIRIVGKEAAESTIGKDKTFAEVFGGENPDFIPQGVSQLENKVVKAQQYINFLNIILKVPPGIINLPKLISKIWKPIGDGDDIVMPQVEAVLIAPEDENILMAQGEKVIPKMMENHPEHIRVHLQVEMTPIVEAHINQHRVIMQQFAPPPLPGQAGAPAQEQPRDTNIPSDLPPGPSGPPPGVPQPSTPEQAAGVGARSPL